MVRAQVAGMVGVVVRVTTPEQERNLKETVYEVEFDPDNVPLALGAELLELV